MKNKFLVSLGTYPGIVYGGESEVTETLRSAFYGFFGFIHSFIWIFALIPVLILGLAVVGAMKKIEKERELHRQRQYKSADTLTGMEGVGIMVGHAVIAVLTVYLIYGTFGVVYADANGFNEVWIKLVTNVWRELFHLSA